MEQHTHNQIITDNRFAVIPHWVIFSDISDGALRLYTVLKKYADNDTGEAFPSRTTLAANIRKKSVRSVDGYIKELKKIKALKVITRKRPGSEENWTNLYVVLTANPHTQGVVQETTPPRAADCSENNTHLPIPTSVSPVIPESQTSVAPLLPDGTQGHAQTSKGSQADPLGPTWYNSEQRQYILKLIHGTALSKAQHNTDYWDRLYDLGSALEEIFNDNEIIMWLIEDRGWEPPRKAVDKFEAAKWLNELIGTWRKELPGLSFPAEDLAA